jgi:dihydrolipoamide dehydrogenase
LLSRGRAYGFNLENLSVDYSEAQQRSRSVVTRQSRRISLLMKNHHIAVFSGVGRIVNTHEVEIDPSGERLIARNITIATGAKPMHLPGHLFDGARIMDLKEVLSSVVIDGAGPIGMEFATLWNRYGAKITVVEKMPHVLPHEDEDISIEAERQFRRVGMDVRPEAG